MIPVLCVDNVVETEKYFTDVLGFTSIGHGKVRYGEDEVVIVSTQEEPAGFIPYAFDHMAFFSPDLEVLQSDAKRRGAKLHSNYTPDGIAELSPAGVNYIFFEAPNRIPVEFCNTKDGKMKPIGHDHFGIRTQSLDTIRDDFGHLTLKTMSDYQLGQTPNLVDIRFLEVDGSVIECFTDMSGKNGVDPGYGWVGYILGR